MFVIPEDAPQFLNVSDKKEVLTFVYFTPVIDSNKSGVVQTNDDGDSSTTTVAGREICYIQWSCRRAR